MAVWTATNIKVARKGLQISFTSDILSDGILNHGYNETNVGIPNDGNVTGKITQIIQNHLAAYTIADLTPDMVSDVALPAPSPTPVIDPVLAAGQTLSMKIVELQRLKGLLDLGVITVEDPAYQTAFTDAQAAFTAQQTVLSNISVGPAPAIKA